MKDGDFYDKREEEELGYLNRNTSKTNKNISAAFIGIIVIGLIGSILLIFLL